MDNTSAAKSLMQSSFSKKQLHQHRTRRTCLWTPLLSAWFGTIGGRRAPDPAMSAGLIGHWPLHGDGTNLVEGGDDAMPHGVTFAATGPSGNAGEAATFNGIDAWLEFPSSEQLQLGRD